MHRSSQCHCKQNRENQQRNGIAKQGRQLASNSDSTVCELIKCRHQHEKEKNQSGFQCVQLPKRKQQRQYDSALSNQAEQRHAFSGHPKHKHCPEQQHSIHRPFSNYRKIPITQENGQIENACSASGNAQEKVGIFLLRNPVKPSSGNACSNGEQPNHLQDTGQKCISNENRCKDENRSKNPHDNFPELLLGIHSLRWRNRLHGLCL